MILAAKAPTPAIDADPLRVGGDFYGTTPNGGNLGECHGLGCGTAYKITPSGTLTALYDFCSLPSCADGAVLYDSLVQGNNGDFYGATWGGGPSNAGTVFKITPKRKLTTLYSFCVADYPYCDDGSNPIGLVLGNDGSFYGTTAFGGGGYGVGTVFKITPSGMLTTIYSFCAQVGCTDGSSPRSGITLGSDGNFYTTTYYGGTYNEGTVFQITPAGVRIRPRVGAQREKSDGNRRHPSSHFSTFLPHFPERTKAA